jgi:phage terminase large subunit-like protein
MLFEAGKVVLHGRFPELEAGRLGMLKRVAWSGDRRALQAGVGYEGAGVSPGRADAMVWGLTELMLRRRAADGAAGGACSANPP